MTRFVAPLDNQFDINGNPRNGAKREFFVVGEVVQKDTFSDEALTIPNTNPVIADATGTFPDIFLSGDYDVELRSSDGTLISGPDTIREFLTASDGKSAKNFTTVSAMIADTGLSLNEWISVEDYATGNNSGYLFFKVVAAATGTDDGGSFIDLPNTTPPLQAKQNFPTERTVKMFGSVGDGDGEGGGTDDSVTNQAALDSLLDGQVLVFNSGSIFRQDTPLSRTGIAPNLTGYGATLDFSNNSTTLAQALTIQGSDSAVTTTVTVDVVKGSNALTVADESGFAAGDYVSMLSDTELLGSIATFTKGEIVRLLSTAANTLNLEGGTRDSYDTSSPTVTLVKIDMITKPTVKGLTIIGSGLSANRHIGLVISRAIEPLVDDCSFIDCSATGVDMNRCMSGLIDNFYVDNCNDLTGPTGYGVSLSNLAMDCAATNGSGERCRHFFNVAGLLPVWNWSLSNSHFRDQLVGATTLGLSTHANGIEGSMTDNSIDNCFAGIGASGPKNFIDGNSATNIKSSACYSLEQDAPWNSTLSNNVGTGPFGVSVLAYTANISVTTVKNNRMYGEATDGNTINAGYTLDAENTISSNNLSVNHSHSYRFRGDNTVSDGDVAIDSNNSQPGQDSAFRILSGDNITIKNPEVKNPNSTTMRHAITIDAGVTNAKLYRGDLEKGTSTIINDLGTNTKSFGHILDGSMPTPAEAVYDFSVDGGAIGVINLNASIPNNAIITTAWYQVINGFTSGGSATVSFGVDINDVTGLKAATAFDNADYSVAFHDFDPDGNAANFTTITGAKRDLIMTIAGAALTAGKVRIWAEYIISE